MESVFKLAAGAVFLIAVPVVAGTWLLGTPDHLAGMITIFMGVVLAMFLVGVMVSSPPGSNGRTQPAPD